MEFLHVLKLLPIWRHNHYISESTMRHALSFSTTCIATAVTLTILTACGGGSSSDAPPATNSTILSGVVATGAPLVGAPVMLKAVSGVLNTTTDANGKYGFDTVGLVGPFVLKATGLDNAALYSAALGSDLGGVINISPLSTMVVSKAALKSGAALFDGFSAADATNLQNGLAPATTTVLTLLTPVFNALGLTPSESGILRGTLVTNNTGLDRVLDAVAISFVGTEVTVADRSGNPIATDDLADTPVGKMHDVQQSDLTAGADASKAAIALFAAVGTNCGSSAKSDSAACAALFTNDYKHGGYSTPASYFNSWWADTGNTTTAIFTNTRIVGASQRGGIAVYKVRVDVESKTPATSASLERVGMYPEQMEIAKVGNEWRVAGDQQDFYLDTHYVSSLNRFMVRVKHPTTTWPSEVAAVLVEGPGLPDAGLLLSGTPTVNVNYGQTELSGCVKLTSASGPCNSSLIFSGGSHLNTFQPYRFKLLRQDMTQVGTGITWRPLKDELN